MGDLEGDPAEDRLVALAAACPAEAFPVGAFLAEASAAGVVEAVDQPVGHVAP